MPTRKQKEQSTLAQVGATVMKAAETVAESANEYVVQPVGKALGLVKTKPFRLSPARKKALKKAAKIETDRKVKGRRPAITSR